MAPHQGSVERWADVARRTLESTLVESGSGACGDVFVEEIRRATVARARNADLPASYRIGRGAALRTWTDEGTMFAAADGGAGSALAACRARLAGAVAVEAPSAGPDEQPEVAAPAAELPDLKETRHFLTGLESSLLRRLVGVELEVSVEITRRDTLVVDDSGGSHPVQWSWIRLELAARAEGSPAVRWLGGAPDLATLRRSHSPQQLARTLDRRLRGALVDRRALPVCVPDTPVMFAAGNGGIVLHEFAHQLEGDLVAHGWSPWGDALQERPGLSPLLTLWDDPNRPRLRGSYALDDEGNPGERLLLVRRGRVTGRLGDRRRREIDPRVHAGHGRRGSWREPPLPRASNLCLAAGDLDPRAVREDRGLQLLVLDIEAGATDPRSGEMTLRVREGEWLENGRTLAPVSGLDLEGNVVDLLARVDRVCVDRHADSGASTCRRHGSGVPIGFFTPTFRSRGLREIERPAADPVVTAAEEAV